MSCKLQAYKSTKIRVNTFIRVYRSQPTKRHCIHLLRQLGYKNIQLHEKHRMNGPI